MRKNIIAILTLAFAILSSNAVTVNNTAGSLASKIDDLSITSLTITGTIDARDLQFISESLTSLKTLNLKDASITAYTSTDADGIIQYRANVVPRYALFGMQQLTAISLPSDATILGDGALAGSSKLTNITMPTALDSIGVAAFNSCHALTSISLPTTLRAIGAYAFSRSGLKSIQLSPNKDFTISEAAFLDCKNLKTVTLGSNVVAIANNAFAGCSALKDVNIATNSRLTNIGKSAFERTAIASLNFLSGHNVQVIDDLAFANGSIVSAQIPTTASTVGDGVLFYNSQLQSFNYHSNEIPNLTLAGSENIDLNSTISEGTTRIGDYAFYNNTTTRELTIPEAVTYIGTRAMAGMTGLTQVTANPTTVPQLGENVWEGINQKSIPLIVESTALAYYRNAPQWMEFNVRTGALLGDVNLDGSVNVGDVGSIYSVILGSDMTDEPRANVNGDDIINVADVSAEYSIIMNGNANFVVSMGYNNDNISIAALEIQPNATANMTITLNNEVNYNSFQMDFNLPRGLAITDAALTERTNGMNLAYRNIGDNTWRVIAADAEAKLIAGQGAMVTLTLTADDSFNGNDDIKVSDILFVEPDITCHYLTPVTVAATATTGIKRIDNDMEPTIVDVYNTQGQLIRRNVDRNRAIEELPQGIYIINGKKIIVN